MIKRLPWCLLPLLALSGCASHKPRETPPEAPPVAIQDASPPLDHTPAQAPDISATPSADTPAADAATQTQAAPESAQPGPAVAAQPPTADAGMPTKPPEPAPAAVPRQSRPCGHITGPDEAMLDETKRRMQETVCSAALWFDGLFGEQNLHEIDAARGSYGKLEIGAGYSSFYGTDLKVRFNAHIDLPNMQKRVSAFIGRDSEDSIVRDRSESYALRSRFPRLDDHDETIAGLGYSLPDNYAIKTEFRTGVRFSGFHVPKAFAQVRMAANAYSDDTNLIDLRLTPFVNTVDGLGVTTSVDLSHVLSPTRLLRFNNVATLTQKTDGVDWRSSLILYQALHEKRAIAYETFVRGLTAAPVPLVEYGVQTLYRQPISHERLYGSLILGYSFPKEDPAASRDGAYSVALVMELPFGNEAKDDAAPPIKQP